MSINNITKYKKAKILTKQLSEALANVNKSIELLEIFKKFSPVQDSLWSLKDSKQILQIHLNIQKDILDKKGLE